MRVFFIFMKFGFFFHFTFLRYFFGCWFMSLLIKCRNLLVISLCQKIRAWPWIKVLRFAQINTRTSRYVHFWAFKTPSNISVQTPWLFKRISNHLLAIWLIECWTNTVAVKKLIEFYRLTGAQSFDNFLLKKWCQIIVVVRLNSLKCGFYFRRLAFKWYCFSIFWHILNLSTKLNEAWFRSDDLHFKREPWMILLFVVDTVDRKSFLFLKDDVVFGKSQSTGRLSPKWRGFVLHFY